VRLGGGGRGSDIGLCLGFESRLHVDREGKSGREMEERRMEYRIERQRQRLTGIVLVVM
jgi:hypothetical protein